MDMENVEIKPSYVGRGVFARSTFQVEELIGEVTGRIIEDEHCGSEYSVDLDGEAVMEPVEPFRLLNHSCEPNCEFVLWGRQAVGTRSYFRVWLQAICPIRPGDELTIDYCWPAVDAIACACGSPSCRGWIVDPDELDHLLFGQEAV